MRHLVAKTPMERRLEALVTPTIEGMGFELVRLRLMGAGGRDAPVTMQIMAERPDGTMEVDDCADISHALSVLLDVEDPIEGEYSLEVSSPGIDRPLTRLKDFAGSAGHRAKVELINGIDGRRRFKGDLMGVSGEGTDATVELTLDDAGSVSLPLRDVAEARLIITDALIRASLNKMPKAERADEIEYEDHIDGD